MQSCRGSASTTNSTLICIRVRRACQDGRMVVVAMALSLTLSPLVRFACPARSVCLRLVAQTSDDAATSKFSAMSLGYFRDEFLEHFLTGPRETARARRAPLINRGYWARVATVTSVVQEFMEAGEGEEEESSSAAATTTTVGQAAPVAAAATAAAPAAASSIPLNSPFHPAFAQRQPPPPPFTPLPFGRSPRIPKQILSLGAGADTTYFKLKSAGLAPVRYVEVDFAAALARKAAVIRRTPLLRDLVAARNATVNDEVFATAQATAADPAAAAAADPLYLPGAHDYSLVGADMRDLPGLEKALQAAGFDFSLPTLILAECVLVYLPADASTSVLEWLASRLVGGALVVNYEQIHPDTPFGRTMVAHLEARGCALLGLRAYPDLPAQAARYERAGWDAHEGWDMNDVYRFYLAAGPVAAVAAPSSDPGSAAAAAASSPIGAAEVRRVERLELFDELEEWHLIQAHYHISMACKEPATSGDASTAPSRRIPWRRLGLLHPARQQRRANPAAAAAAANAAAAHSGSIVVGGRTIMLGGAGPRASKPLEAQSANHASSSPSAGTLHVGPSKGSLRRPPPQLHDQAGL